MKYRIAFTALAAAVASAAGAASPDVRGLWTTPVGATVELAPCGANLCGKLVSSPGIRANPAATDRNNKNAALRGRKLKGLTIVWGFKPSAGGWSGGRIYNPGDGKIYSGSIDPAAGGMLKVKGCVASLMGINFCGLQQWKRAR
ncbi:MAG TPA: DUF2147 domain-containing protein [Allosphingosinicella sp.]